MAFFLVMAVGIAYLWRIQTERRHKVIDTDPYAAVRCRLYSGALLMCAGIPPGLGVVLGPDLPRLVSSSIPFDFHSVRLYNTSMESPMRITDIVWKEGVVENMRNRNKRVDGLPDEFKSYEEAAEFWGTHSITDYEEFLEPVDVDVDIQRRHFQIEVDEESFRALRETAKKEQKPVKQLASEILRQTLRAG